MTEPIVCTPRVLRGKSSISAAARAIKVNPANQVPTTVVSRAVRDAAVAEARIAVMIGKRWAAAGVRLGVGFLDNPPIDLRARILSHLNAWAKTANVEFREASIDPEVRIARLDSPPAMAGYWSYVGTDILEIDPSEPTMNLEGFTMNTDDAEFVRVVRHEAGHTLGFPHEHMRRELVEMIDEQKAIRYFELTQGWDEEEVRQQVLTPIEDSAILGTPHADPNSIMCYQIPARITRNGKAILGGPDIDEDDYAFAASVYPKAFAT